jgi:hypothetical protein
MIRSPLLARRPRARGKTGHTIEAGTSTKGHLEEFGMLCDTAALGPLLFRAEMTMMTITFNKQSECRHG